LVIIIGYAVLRIVNLPRRWVLDSVFNFELSSKGLPQETISQIVYAIYIFFVGVISSIVVVLISKRKPWMHLCIFCGLLLANDLYAITGPLSYQPLWLKIEILIVLVPHVWLGGVIGLALKRRFSSN